MFIKKTKITSLYRNSFLTVMLISGSATLANTPVVCPPKATPCCTAPCKERRAFIKLITGASFSRKANISANPAIWDPALEGYNAALGNAPLLGAAFGYQFFDFLSGDVSVTHRWGYSYSKFQTTPTNPGTPQALPSKTRKFDLDNTSIMFNARLHGKGINGLCYATDTAGSYISPILGVGIGLSLNRMRNFRSIIAPTALTAPLNGVASIGPSSTIKTSFSYQLEAGLEYKFQNTWGFSVGYRWFDGGKFRSPPHNIAGTGLPGNPLVGTNVTPWTGRLQNHEVFVEVAYHF